MAIRIAHSEKLKENDDAALARGGKTKSFGRQAADKAKPGKTGKAATTSDKTAFAKSTPKPHSGGRATIAKAGATGPR